MKENANVVKTNNEKSKELTTKIGVKHRCVLNAYLFSIVIDGTLKEVKKETKTKVELLENVLVVITVEYVQHKNKFKVKS